MDNCSERCTKNDQQINLLNVTGVEIDAFGRQRISQPFTLFDSHNRYGPDEQFFSNTSGGSTITYNALDSTVYLNLGSNVSEAVRQSKEYFDYQPGKSLLIMTTFKLAPKSSNIIQRVGYFDQQNGIFLELNDKLYIVLRKNGTETKVEQTQWNNDTMNGLGPSKAMLDITKVQLFWMDIEWLGVGTVRTGFLIDGRMVPVHYFHHANMSTSVYIKSAHLPVRYEISGSGSGSLHQICSTVISEGGYEPRVPLVYQQVGTTKDNGITLATAGQLYPVLSLRATDNSAIITLKSMNLVVTSADSVTWYLILNPVIQTPSWVNHSQSNLIQVDTSSTTVSGGTIVFQSIVQQRDQFDFSSEYNIKIGAKSFTESDVLTLAAAGFSPNLKVAAVVGWSEL